MHTTHTSRSHSRSGSYVSHGEDTKNLQLEIDHLHRKLHRKQRRGTPSSSGSQSNDDEDYKPISRTPPSESFPYSEERHHRQRSRSPTYKGLGNDTMSKALHQISKSQFTRRIKRANLPWWFTQPMFTMYSGRTNLVEHVNHFNQRMAIDSKNEALMCKVFPSSLGPLAMRWFDGLKEGFINSFQQLTKAFGARFVSWSKVPHPLDSLLSMTTLKTNFDRYCEMFNETGGDFEDVSIKTFKVGLPAEHKLRKSLSKKLAQSMHQLMDQIDKHKRVEDDQQQGKEKGKMKEIPHDRRDFRSERYNSNRPKRDFSRHTRHITTQVVNTVFREPIHQVLEKQRMSHISSGHTRWEETP